MSEQVPHDIMLKKIAYLGCPMATAYNLAAELSGFIYGKTHADWKTPAMENPCICFNSLILIKVSQSLASSCCQIKFFLYIFVISFTFFALLYGSLARSLKTAPLGSLAY